MDVDNTEVPKPAIVEQARAIIPLLPWSQDGFQVPLERNSRLLIEDQPGKLHCGCLF
jgi:hypothetical protein